MLECLTEMDIHWTIRTAHEELSVKQTRLFDWATEQGLTMSELARRIGYSRRHLYRIRSGQTPITEEFVARVVLRLGERARSLFFCDVSQ